MTLNDKIVQQIRKHREYETASVAYMNIRRNNPRAYPYDYLGGLTARINMVKAWLAMLPENEAYVVQRHLVDGLEWTQITHEYKEKWGKDNARAERTLVRYHTNAIRKIEHFVREHLNWYSDFLDTDIPT